MDFAEIIQWVTQHAYQAWAVYGTAIVGAISSTGFLTAYRLGKTMFEAKAYRKVAARQNLKIKAMEAQIKSLTQCVSYLGEVVADSNNKNYNIAQRKLTAAKLALVANALIKIDEADIDKTDADAEVAEENAVALMISEFKKAGGK